MSSMRDSSEIRQAFLDFFAGKGHHVVPSASLVPLADPSLLLVNAGMAPMKRYFLGKEAPPASRMASCQKCVRVVDIDRVGLTNRHNTFFEMLGNFSFGDYFKAEAIDYAWEFLTGKEWAGLNPAYLYVSTHENDPEAPGLWEQVAGVPPDRIFGLGDRHNLWAAGETGPCGYDTEIFYDLERAAENPCRSREDFERMEEAGRMVEVWNLVFMEFNRDESGKMTPLPKKNIDTGMGLERLATVLQGRQNVFECDLFAYLVEYFTRLIGAATAEERVQPEQLQYNPFWLCADHMRTAAFMLADNITPSNLDRGYVLRRVVRRIVKTSYLLGVRKPYLAEPAQLVIEKMGDAYPELHSRKDNILTWLAREEEGFLNVLARGVEELESVFAQRGNYPVEGLARRLEGWGRGLPPQESHMDMLGSFVPQIKELAERQLCSTSVAQRCVDGIKRLLNLLEEAKGAGTLFQSADSGLFALSPELQSAWDDVLTSLDNLVVSLRTHVSGKFAFTLHDTYGFPFEVTQELARLRGYEVDEEEFKAEMEQQRQRGREAAEFNSEFQVEEGTMANGEVEFVGYETLTAKAAVRGVKPFAGKVEAKEKDAVGADEAKGKELHLLYTDRTPFYAETGGQPGDMGWATAEGVRFRVVDSKNLGEHIGFFAEGDASALKEGAEVELAVDEKRRKAIARAHTTAHAMLAALKQVLGDHVNQAGSQIYPDRIRFDFSHYEAMTPEQLREVERVTNEILLADYPVWTQQMPLVDAKREGVTAVFDEKYGETVRVVNMGEEGRQVSRELCGGTHLTHSSQAGSFVIVKEESVQSGIRRLEAAVGLEAQRFLSEYRQLGEELMRGFRVPLNEVEETVERLRRELKEKHEELAVLKRGALYDQIAGRVAEPETVGRVALVVGRLDGAGKDDVKNVIDRAARELAKAGKQPYAVLIVRADEKSAALTLKFSPELPKAGVKAGAVVREMARVMGGGGGGADAFAEAGGRDPSRLDEAIRLLRDKLAAVS